MRQPGHDPNDPTANGMIGDTIFLDTGDGAGGAPNGTPDPGEGLEGVTVELYDATGAILLATTTTDENGNYYFGGVDPTVAHVVKVDPTTLPNAGAGLTNTIDPDGSAPLNESSCQHCQANPI